jgi:hypothetical protein
MLILAIGTHSRENLGTIITDRPAGPVESYGRLAQLLPTPFDILVWAALAITAILGSVIVVLWLCVAIKQLWQSLRGPDDEGRSRSRRDKR